MQSLERDGRSRAGWGELTFQREGGAALDCGQVVRALDGGGVLPDPGGVVTWPDTGRGVTPVWPSVGGWGAGGDHFFDSAQPPSRFLPSELS